jgi:thioredoxin-related protein
MFKLFFLLIGFSYFVLAQNLITYTNYDQALAVAKKENKPLLMFVYTDYCPWCDKMKKNTLSHKKTIEFIQKNYIFLSVNKDNSVYPEKFIPRYIPTTYLIDATNEEELYALYGYKTTTELIKELDDDEL